MSDDEQATFKDVVLNKFVPALRDGHISQGGLRIKSFRSRPGVFEMRWGSDGRALFRFGEERVPGETHIIWIAVGSHEIYDH